MKDETRIKKLLLKYNIDIDKINNEEFELIMQAESLFQINEDDIKRCMQKCNNNKLDCRGIASDLNVSKTSFYRKYPYLKMFINYRNAEIDLNLKQWKEKHCLKHNQSELQKQIDDLITHDIDHQLLKQDYNKLEQDYEQLKNQNKMLKDELDYYRNLYKKTLN